MAELWELICHHTYTGVPGLIFDRSPLGASHGKAVGLAQGDFLADGAVSGSGSISFHKPNGRVYVPADASAWRTIGGIRGEVTLRSDFSRKGVLLHSNSFGFFIGPSTLSAWVYSHAQITSQLDAVGAPWAPPAGQWVTVGFMHDGFGTMELYADGEVIARQNAAYNPVHPPDAEGISIGNSHDGGKFANGRIDSVKIWRLNPRRFDEEFFSRPMDAETADCWKRFLGELRHALSRHPECVALLSEQVRKLVVEHIRQILAAPGGAARLAAATRDYNRLWRQGKINGPEMAKIFTDLLQWLGSVGLDPQNNPALAGLVRSKCYQAILGDISPPTCDGQLKALYDAVATAAAGAGPGPSAGKPGMTKA